MENSDFKNADEAADHRPFKLTPGRLQWNLCLINGDKQVFLDTFVIGLRFECPFGFLLVPSAIVP